MNYHDIHPPIPHNKENQTTHYNFSLLGSVHDGGGTVGDSHVRVDVVVELLAEEGAQLGLDPRHSRGSAHQHYLVHLLAVHL